MQARSLAKQNASCAKPTTQVSSSEIAEADTTSPPALRRLLRDDFVCFTGFARDATADASAADKRGGDSNGIASPQSTLRGSLNEYVGMAEWLGATVQPHLKRSTRWLVAAQGLTAKRIMAEKVGLDVVAPEWLRHVVTLALGDRSATGSDHDSEESTSTSSLRRDARKRFAVRCLSGYLFSCTHLGDAEADALRSLLGDHGARLSHTLSADCDAVLVSRDDANALRRALRRLPATVPTIDACDPSPHGEDGASRTPEGPASGTQASMTGAAVRHVRATLRASVPAPPSLVDSKSVIALSSASHASPLAHFLGPLFSAKLWFAWQHGIPVVPYDHLLQAVRGLDEEEADNATDETASRRRERWSQQVDLDSLLESCHVQAPPAQWLVHNDAGADAVTGGSPLSDGEAHAEMHTAHDEASDIEHGFFSRPFHLSTRSYAQRSGHANAAMSEVDTVSEASYSPESSFSSPLSTPHRSATRSDEDVMDTSAHHAPVFLEPGGSCGAVVETCASDALVTQPDYFSASHTLAEGDGDNGIGEASLSRHVAAYYTLKRNAQDAATPAMHHHPPISVTSLLSAPTAAADDDGVTHRANGDDAKRSEGRRAQGAVSSAIVRAPPIAKPPQAWSLTPRNATAHIQVALWGCTEEEVRQGVSACLACRFLRTPLPTSQTDIVVLGSELLKKKKFVDRKAGTSVSAAESSRGQCGRAVSLRRMTPQRARGAGSRVASVRLFYECQPAVLEHLETVYGIPAQQVVPLAWLRACVARVNEAHRATAAPALADAPVVAYASQENDAEETARWPSDLLGPQPATNSGDSPRLSEVEPHTTADESDTTFAPLPPLALNEWPNPRERHFRIQRRAARFVEPAQPAGPPTAQPASAADGPTASTPQAPTTDRRADMPSSVRHTTADTAVPAALSPLTQDKRDRERAARVLRGLIDLVTPLEEAELCDGDPSTVVASTQQDRRQMQLVAAHALRGLLVCLVDGQFDRAELGVARGLVNVGGGKWVKKTSEAWREALAKRAVRSDQREQENDDEAAMMERVRAHAVYAKRASQWWGRRHILRVPNARTTTADLTAAGVRPDALEVAAGEDSQSQLCLAESESDTNHTSAAAAAQLRRLAQKCRQRPVVYLVPHADQRAKVEDGGAETPNGGTAARAQAAMRFVVPITTDYLLWCLACERVLNPRACFLFHTPIPSAPDMSLLQHTTRRQAAAPSADVKGRRPPAISPWVWERRYAKARAVGVSVCIVWCIGTDSLCEASEEAVDDVAAPRDTHVPDAQTAALMRVALYGLHHVITALGGTLVEVYDPAAVTHVLQVDLEFIRHSTWDEMYEPTSSDPLAQDVPRVCWPQGDVQRLATASAAQARGVADEVCPVTLAWLEASVRWGIFVHEDSSEAFRWQPTPSSLSSLDAQGGEGASPARGSVERARGAATHLSTPRAIRTRQQHIAQQFAEVRARAVSQEPPKGSCGGSHHASVDVEGSLARTTTPPLPPFVSAVAADVGEEGDGTVRMIAAADLTVSLATATTTTPPRPRAQVTSVSPARPAHSQQDSHSRPSCCTPPPRVVHPPRGTPHDSEHGPVPRLSVSPSRTPSRRSASRGRSLTQHHNTQSLADQEEKDRYLVHLSDCFQFRSASSTPLAAQRRTASPPSGTRRQNHRDSTTPRRCGSSGVGLLSSSPPRASGALPLTPRRVNLREQSAAMAVAPLSALGLADEAETRRSQSKRHRSGSRASAAGARVDEDGRVAKKTRLSARALRFSPDRDDGSKVPSPSLTHTHHGASPRVLVPDSFVASSPPVGLSGRERPSGGQSSWGDAQRDPQAQSPQPAEARVSSREASSTAAQARRHTRGEELMLIAPDDRNESNTVSAPSLCEHDGLATVSSSARVTPDARASSATAVEDGVLVPTARTPRLGMAVSRSTTPPPRPPRKESSVTPAVIEVASGDDDEEGEVGGDGHERHHHGSAEPYRHRSPQPISLVGRANVRSSANRESSKNNDAAGDVLDSVLSHSPGVLRRPLRLYVLHDVPHREALVRRCAQLSRQTQLGLLDDGAAQVAHARRTPSHARKRSRSPANATPRLEASVSEPRGAGDGPVQFVARCEEADVVVTHEVTARETVLAAVAAGLWVVRATALDDLAERLGRGFTHFYLSRLDAGGEADVAAQRTVVTANAEALHWLELHEWGPECLPQGVPDLHVQLARQCRLRRREAQRSLAAAVSPSRVPSSLMRAGLFSQSAFVLFLPPPGLMSLSTPTRVTAHVEDPPGHGTDCRTIPAAGRSSTDSESRASSSTADARRMDKRCAAVRRLISAGGGRVRDVVVLGQVTPEASGSSSTRSVVEDTPPPDTVLRMAPALDGAEAGLSAEDYFLNLLVKALADLKGDEPVASAAPQELLLLLDTPLLAAHLQTATTPGAHKPPLVSCREWMAQQLTTQRAVLCESLRPRWVGTDQRGGEVTVRVSLRSFSWLARVIAGDTTADKVDGGTFCVVDLVL